jgi:hypothetical protein
MSEPKRYDVGMTEETNSRTGFYASFPRVYEAEQGKYVEYADYALLKAEVERLRFIGDEIIMDVYRSECLTDKWCKMARKWDTAKEGKQP